MVFRRYLHSLSWVQSHILCLCWGYTNRSLILSFCLFSLGLCRRINTPARDNNLFFSVPVSAISRERNLWKKPVWNLFRRIPWIFFFAKFFNAMYFNSAIGLDLFFGMFIATMLQDLGWYKPLFMNCKFVDLVKAHYNLCNLAPMEVNIHKQHMRCLVLGSRKKTINTLSCIWFAWASWVSTHALKVIPTRYGIVFSCTLCSSCWQCPAFIFIYTIWRYFTSVSTGFSVWNLGNTFRTIASDWQLSESLLTVKLWHLT